MINRAPIKEIFTSIQGEGIYIGCKQLFVRFCGCNLRCHYCDTDFDKKDSVNYTVDELVSITEENSDCHSVSLTGGEPLLHEDFLKEFLPQCKLPVYLETNATLYTNFAELSDYVNYVAADIKLPSCTGEKAYWDEHDKFFNEAAGKDIFAKVVFDKNITDEEIQTSAALCSKYGIELILQPKNNSGVYETDMEFIEKIMDKFLNEYKKIRLIPQVHKFLNIR